MLFRNFPPLEKGKLFHTRSFSSLFLELEALPDSLIIIESTIETSISYDQLFIISDSSSSSRTIISHSLWYPGILNENVNLQFESVRSYRSIERLLCNQMLRIMLTNWSWKCSNDRTKGSNQWYSEAYNYYSRIQAAFHIFPPHSWIFINMKRDIM